MKAVQLRCRSGDHLAGRFVTQDERPTLDERREEGPI
jgi:hypothetical protein